MTWLTEQDPWLVPAMRATSTINRGEKKVLKAVAKAIELYLLAARAAVLSEPTPKRIQNLQLEGITLTAAEDIPPDMSAWPTQELWTALVNGEIIPVIIEIYDAAFKAVLRGVQVAIESFRSAYIATVRDRLVSAAWPTDAFTYVRSLLDTSIREGGTITELTNQIKNILNINAKVDGEPVWQWQARRIARTETIGAYNGATYSGAQAWTAETGQTRFKKWLATRDTRTRHTHRVANGQVAPLDGTFTVGASTLLFPGDPTGPAREVINCRCSFLILSEEEAQKDQAQYLQTEPTLEPAVTASTKGTTMETKTLVAAVIGSADLPLAPREHEWDGPAAEQRVAEWAKDPETGEISPEKYRDAFFWRDSEAPETNVTAYKLGFADVIDGELQAIPRGLFAVAGVLQGARGGVDIPQEDQDQIRGHLNSYYARMAEEFDDESITPPWDSMTAASSPFDVDLFANPGLKEPTMLTFDEETGRIYGHLASWNTCHVGITHTCTTPPKSNNGYEAFNRHSVDTTGGPLATGRLTAAFGEFSEACDCCPGSDDHACINLSAADTIAQHDKMQTLAIINVGDDDIGIWYSGVLSPDITAAGRDVLKRRKVSGDWRGGELVELLALSSAEPGFPISRERTENQSSYALVAAGVVQPASECACSKASEEEPQEERVHMDTREFARQVAEEITVIASTEKNRIRSEEVTKRADKTLRKVRAAIAAEKMRELERA